MTITEAIAWLNTDDFESVGYNKAIEMAIKALEKDIPKKPISKPDGFGLIIKLCPNCGTLVYDPDWTISTKKVYFTRRCQKCGQLFTKLGKYFGTWEDDEDETV